MPAIPSELLFPNAWLRRKVVHVLTSAGEGRVRLSRGKGGGTKSLFEGPLAEASVHLPKGAWLVSALPLQRSLSRQLHPPVSSTRTAGTLLEGLFDTDVPFPLDQARYGFPDITKAEGGIRALGIAARKQDVSTHLETLQNHGFDPHQLDHEGLALWTQTLHELRTKADGRPRALAHCEDGRTVLVFGRGTTFLNAQVLSVPPDDPTFPHRLERAVRAQFPGNEDVAWRVSGMPPADLPPPLASARQHKRPGTFLDRALSRRALRPGPLRFNFRTDHPELQNARTRRNRSVALHLLIPGLLLWAATLGWSHFMQRQDAAIQSELAQTAEAITGFKVPKGQELLEVQRAVDARTTGAAHQSLQRFAHPRADQQLRNALHFARRNNMHIDALRFDGNKLVLTGTNVLPLERKLPELGAYQPELTEGGGQFTLTLSLP